MKRQLITLLLVVLFVLSAGVVFAGGSKEAPASAATASPGVVNLGYFQRNNDPTDWSYFNWIVNTFNKQHAGKIHVTLSGIDGNTYRTKAPIELQSDNGPDVYFSWAGGWADKMVSSGFAAPLDKYYQKYDWSTILNPSGAKLATINGHKYFVPTEMAASFVWYRPDIFTKYNIQVPKTWNQFLQVCQTLKSHGVYPLEITDGGLWEAQFVWTGIYVNKFGLAKYDDLLYNKMPWTDPSVAATFALERSLVAKGYVYPGYLSTHLATGVIPFSQGKVAMWYQGTFLISTLLGNHKSFTFPLGFFKFPSFPGVQRTVEVWPENTVMINAKSTHKNQAAEFVNWIVSTKAQQKKVDMQLPYAANTRVDLAPLLPIAKQAGGVMGTVTDSFMHIDLAFNPAIAQTFLTQLQGVLSGDISPEAAAAATEATATRVRGPVK